MSQESMPQFAPPSSDTNPGSAGSSNTFRSGESRESFQQSTSRAKQVKATLQSVITSRDQLANYLAGYGMKLLTSAVEYERSKDFVASSYILYEAYNNYLEPLSDFLVRYPDYQASIEYIVAHLATN
jgi:hypothetical protein